MYKKVLFFALLNSFLFISCKPTSEHPDSYFDSLVVAQVRSLTAAKAHLSKTARIRNREDQATFTPDSAVWDSELDIFRQLSVFEKPAYRDAYKVRDRIQDPKSNLFIRWFKASKNVPVREMKFYYLGQFKHLKKLEASYHEENTLYSTKLFLWMEFDDINSRMVLDKYGMEGIQKMVLSDSVPFSIKSSISF